MDSQGMQPQPAHQVCKQPTGSGDTCHGQEGPKTAICGQAPAGAQVDGAAESGGGQHQTKTTGAVEQSGAGAQSRHRGDRAVGIEVESDAQDQVQQAEDGVDGEDAKEQ